MVFLFPSTATATATAHVHRTPDSEASLDLDFCGPGSLGHCGPWSLVPLSPGIQCPRAREDQWACAILWVISPLARPPGHPGRRVIRRRSHIPRGKTQNPARKNSFMWSFCLVKRYTQTKHIKEFFVFSARDFDFSARDFHPCWAVWPGGRTRGDPWLMGPDRPARLSGPWPMDLSAHRVQDPRCPSDLSPQVSRAIEATESGFLDPQVLRSCTQGQKNHKNTKDFFGTTLSNVFC